VLGADRKLIRVLRFDVPEHAAQALIQAITNDLRGVKTADFLSYGDNATRTQKSIGDR
jgi:hypothetical protein